ncbi:hypothetical protein SAMN05421818_10357 [Myroides phaeus]|uniref:Uncharacterized protein n=1 Tax=Myroides phaeus TaxID=702745 RepID=A0A1G8C0J7_9FLAO|nr:hypothetical protein SAMN05421818_10357 [Myroides phaeus]
MTVEALNIKYTNTKNNIRKKCFIDQDNFYYTIKVYKIKRQKKSPWQNTKGSSDIIVD